MLGNNTLLRIEYRSASADDEVGGFAATGTIPAATVWARVEGVQSIEQMLTPGYETNRQYDVALEWDVLIREGDYVLILNATHPDYGRDLRVLAVTQDSIPSSRGHKEVRVAVERRAQRSNP